MERVRIGELSRRTGVDPTLLRAWEHRYGLLRPARTDGGFRLYTADDVERVRRMQAHLAEGLSAAEAARAALALAADAGDSAARGLARSLDGALLGFDEPEAQRLLDQLVLLLSVESLIGDVVLPILARIGDRWQAGDVDVAQEHFATNVVRTRLLALARGWGNGGGPLGLLACPPGELHDVGLVCFGLALRQHGWRIAFLGADTPVDVLLGAAARLEPSLIVVASTTAEALSRATPDLARLAAGTAVRLAGAAATREAAAAAGLPVLDGDPVTAAATVAAAVGRPQNVALAFPNIHTT